MEPPDHGEDSPFVDDEEGVPALEADKEGGQEEEGKGEASERVRQTHYFSLAKKGRQVKGKWGWFGWITWSVPSLSESGATANGASARRRP